MLDQKAVYENLKRLGVPTNLKGYQALVHAVTIVGENPPPRSMTKEVYPRVAEIVGSTGSRVERSIRHAVERVFSETDPDVLMEYFGNTASGRKGKLTNSEFIYGIVEYIKQTAA